MPVTRACFVRLCVVWFLRISEIFDPFFCVLSPCDYARQLRDPLELMHR